MGILKKTTEEINALFDKVDRMPEEGAIGKTPVLTTGNTTTLEAGAQATSNVVNIGTDAEGNPKYRIDFGIPKGADGQDGSSSGGGVADSVQWSKVLNKPAWVDSPSKPAYSASEVNAIAIGGLKTINGQSIEGEGNIIIEGGGSSGGGIDDAPTDGVLYGRKNNDWVIVDETSVNSNNVVLDLTDLHSITNHNSTNESVLSTFGGQAKMNEIALKLASNPMMYHAYNGYYMMKSMVDYNYIGNGNFDTEDSIMYLSISASVPALKTAAAGLELFQFDDVELTLLYEKKANVDGEIKDFVIRHKFRNGYYFLEEVKKLTNESTVDDFKNAFGEYKFDEYIQYSNDGNKFYVVDDTQPNGKLELYISAFNIENETFTLRCDKGTIWGYTDGAQMVVNYKDFTVTISSFTPEKSLSDAPKDGNTYGRNNGNWVVVSNEGGGSGGTAEVNLFDIYDKLSSDGGTISQEDYNTLLSYANNNTKVTITGYEPYNKFAYVGLVNMSGTLIWQNVSLAYGTWMSITIAIMANLSYQMVGGSMAQGLILGDYQKANSYTAITSEDSVQSAIAKLEAGIGGGSSGGGDNRYKLNTAILGIRTGSTSEEISSAVGGIDGYNEIIQAVKDGKKLYVSESESELYVELTATFKGMDLLLQGMFMSIFGASLYGMLGISYSDNVFIANSYSIDFTEVPSKS